MQNSPLGFTFYHFSFLRVHLDTAYFAENNKKIIFGYCSHKKYYSFALMHCSCPINSVRGAGKKKKPKTRTPWMQTPIQTEILSPKLYYQVYFNLLSLYCCTHIILPLECYQLTNAIQLEP